MEDWLAEAKGKQPRRCSEPMTLKQALKEHNFTPDDLKGDERFASDFEADEAVRQMKDK